MNKREILEKIQGKLIVSCQALEDEPLYTEEGGVMPLMAIAAQQGGAVAIRANSVRDVKQIKEKIDLPIIGLIKKQYPLNDQFITVTMHEVDQLVEAGAEIVALDCTDRPRYDGKNIKQHIKDIKEKYPDLIILADISTYEEGIAAAEAGVDLVGTTLNGYTEETKDDLINGANFSLVYRLSRDCLVPIIAEGRIHYPWEVKKMLSVGAWSVVVGGAITRPYEITRRFVDMISK